MPVILSNTLLIKVFYLIKAKLGGKEEYLLRKKVTICIPRILHHADATGNQVKQR
ncbi:MAG: hypothetical protein ACTS7E_05080 [Arsenophonus sp. NC-CH8-MAG3]